MPTNWTISEIDNARKAVATLLEALELEAFLFEVEPVGDQWEVKLEWATEQVWTTVNLAASHNDLLQSLDDVAVRNMLLSEWRLALGFS